MVEVIGRYSNHGRLLGRIDKIKALPQISADRTRPTRRQIQTRLRDDQIQLVLDRYRSGNSANQIAAEFGLHRKTVVQHLKDHNITIRYRLLKPEAVTEAAVLYHEGWSLARLGEQFKVDASTVRRALLEAGYTTRPRVGR